MSKVIVGFIAYKNATAKYLPSFMASLKQQTFTDYECLVYDNSPLDDLSNRQVLKQHKDIKILGDGHNLGFAAAYNILIKEALNHGAEYFLIVNPDTWWTPFALAKLVKVLDKDAGLAAVAPKIRRWDFAHDKLTNIIDSCGLAMTKSFYFFDIGQGELDRGQYDEAEILAPSGAAGLWRLSALQSLAEQGQYFDERFFMYKEDCDLAYRLKLKGGRACLVAEAVIYHDRTTAAKRTGWLGSWLSRQTKTEITKNWSWAGQQILVRKHWRGQKFGAKLMIGLRQILLYIYVALFEPALFKKRI